MNMKAVYTNQTTVDSSDTAMETGAYQLHLCHDRLGPEERSTYM